VLPPNGRKVAVVGAGPAGLSCAYYLALKGYKVTLLEALPEAGGMLPLRHPRVSAAQGVLDLEINQILDLGVELSTNVVLGRDYTVASLKQGGYDAVFLGIGAWTARRCGLRTRTARACCRGSSSSSSSGSSAGLDLYGACWWWAAATPRSTALALRCGSARPRCASSTGATRKEMPANEMEIVEAEHEGRQDGLPRGPGPRAARREGRAAAVECIRMELGEPDASGRRSPKPLRAPSSESTATS